MLSIPPAAVVYMVAPNCFGHEQKVNSWKQAWEKASWSIPVSDIRTKLSPEWLAFLRGKYSAYRSLVNLKWNDLMNDGDINAE